MILVIKKDKTVGEMQYEFGRVYPYLKVEVFKPVGGIRQKLLKTALLSASNNMLEGEVDIQDSMTVGQLEKAFYDKFRMNVQVARKSGGVWIETTMTNNWTLKQQNDHGRELSEPLEEK